MLGMTLGPCDENTTEERVADSVQSVADMCCKNKAAVTDDKCSQTTNRTAKRRRRSEPVCQLLERHPSDHDLEIVSMPPPLHRKDATLQKRRASAPAPITNRPQKTHIQITIPDIADDHSGENAAGTGSSVKIKTAPESTVGRDQDTRSYTPQQRRSSDTGADRRGSDRRTNHGLRVGAVSSTPVKLIQKRDSTNERRNSILPTANKTRVAVRTPRADNGKTKAEDDEETTRTGKVRVVSITATVRRKSQNKDNRRGTERSATPKGTPRRLSVPQRRMSTVTGSKFGMRRKSVPANTHSRTIRGKQKAKQVEKELENDQELECDQVVSSRHIASDLSLTSAMDQQLSTISIKCSSSENVTIMQDLQHSQSLNSSSCGLFQVELNRAFTYSYFQFLPPHFPK